VRASQAIGLLYGCITLSPALLGAQASAPPAGGPAVTPPTASAGAGKTYKLAVPTTEIQGLLMTQVFTDTGRFYPCRSLPSCSAWGQNLALSAPSVQIDGPRLVFSVHVSGTYVINQMFAPSIAGDLILSAVPVVRAGVIHLSQSSVKSGPGDITFQAFVEAVHLQIEQMLNEKGELDLAPYLVMSAHDPSLPPPRIPGVTCLDKSQIHVQSVATDPAASAITTSVLVDPPAPGRKSC
jgi:hypothetical protein